MASLEESAAVSTFHSLEQVGADLSGLTGSLWEAIVAAGFRDDVGGDGSERAFKKCCVVAIKTMHDDPDVLRLVEGEVLTALGQLAGGALTLVRDTTVGEAHTSPQADRTVKIFLPAFVSADPPIIKVAMFFHELAHAVRFKVVANVAEKAGKTLDDHKKHLAIQTKVITLQATQRNPDLRALEEKDPYNDIGVAPRTPRSDAGSLLYGTAGLDTHSGFILEHKLFGGVWGHAIVNGSRVVAQAIENYNEVVEEEIVPGFPDEGKWETTYRYITLRVLENSTLSEPRKMKETEAQFTASRGILGVRKVFQPTCGMRPSAV